MRKALIPLLLFSVLTLLTFFAYQSYRQSSLYISVQKELSQDRGVDQTIQSKFDKLFEKLSMGIYDDYSTDKLYINHLEHKAQSAHQLSRRALYNFFGAVVIFIAIFWMLDRTMALLFLSLCALVSLLFALISPLVMVHVYQTVPVLGEVTLSFEYKTILSTLQKLFVDGNYLIGVAVLLFSVLIPLFKTLVILIYAILKETHSGEKWIGLIEKIGKWSMADVFIVALMVVFFTTNQDIHTALRLEVGIYFFIGYVLLSLFASEMIKTKGNDSPDPQIV